MKLFGIEITRRVKAVSKVPGFAVSIEVKEGTLLTHDAKDKKPPKPASENTYYEIAMQSTGENPEYPKSNEPLIVRFTVALSEGYGMTGGTHYIPMGARYTHFEVGEDYDDGTLKPGLIGRLMPAHHSVMLRAHYRTKAGMEMNMAIGGWVRKSERERPEWKIAAVSPICCI